MVRNVCLASVLVLLSGAARVTAQDEQPRVTKKLQKDLDSVVVVAADGVRKVTREGFAVTSIATRELKNSAGDARDVLNRATGVRILEEGGLGSGYNLTLNGFSGQQVKVFIDNMPADRYSSAYNLSNISVNAIERIDIYKGVVPVTLGTDALGGVVNIITNQQRNFLDASYTIGSFNTHRPSLNGAYTHRKSGFTVRGSAGFNYSDNNYKVYVPIVRNNTVAEYRETPRFHDRYRSGNLRIETGVTGRKYADQLLIGLTAAADDKQVQHGATMNSVYGGITTRSNTLSPMVRYAKKNLLVQGLEVNAFGNLNASETRIADTLKGVVYNWLGEATITPGSNAGELSRTNTTLTDREWNAGANAGYRITPRQALVVNYLYSRFHRTVQDAENPNRPENNFPKQLTKGILSFGHNAEWRKGLSSSLFGKLYTMDARAEKWLNFALPTQRLEDYRTQQTGLGYGLATAYFPVPALQLKASYERAYRMPSAEEMFGDGLFVQSNPELKPEWSHNANLGVSYNKRLNENHSISVSGSLLYRRASDLIYRIASISGPVTRYGNLKETKTRGIEGNAAYWWKQGLRLQANLTYQVVTDEADFIYINSYTGGGQQVNYQKGFRVPNIPSLFGNGSAGYRFNKVLKADATLDVNYRFNYVDAYFLTWAELGSHDSKKVIPQQASHDLELVYALQNGRYNIGAECRNLTNERLYDRFYLQKAGRAFFLKLRFTL